MAVAYSNSVVEGQSPQYAYGLAILSGGIAFVVAQLGDTIAVWLSYALLAALFSFLWPHGAWQWAGWLCLPILLLIFFDLIVIGSFQRFVLDMAGLVKALPLTCGGVYIGSKLSMRKIIYRRLNLQRKRMTHQQWSNPASLRPDEPDVPAAVRQPSFSTTRQIRAIEPVPPPQSLTEALIKAAQTDDLDKIELLVAQGVDVNATSDDKCTPLMIAALGGDAQMVEALFGKRAEVKTAGCDGWTALMIATIEGHAEAVRALIEHGADVNAVNHRGWTAARFAVSMDEAEILRQLLQAGADANLQDAQGQTALMQAAGEDSSEIIKLLLDAGADPHLKDKDGRTALMIARERGSARSIKLLKEAIGSRTPEVDVAGCIRRGDDSYLYLLKEELEEKLSQAVSPSQHAHADATEMLHSALQVVREQIESSRKERLLAPSEIAHKLTLSLREASTLSGLPRRHLLEAVEAGTLQAKLITHGWRITRAALDDYVRRLPG